MAFPLSARSGQRPAPSPSNPVLLATQSQWLFTDEELTRTPSQLDGMKMEAEYVSRCKGVNFITQVGIMLRLPQLTIATAAVYLQRFFMRYSMADLLPHRPGMHPYPVAATSLFLATKVEENVRRMREFVVACCRVAQKQPNLVVDEQSREYWKWRDTILHHEDLLLEAICFDLQLEQPYRILYDFLCFFAVNENKSLRNASWAFINDSMYTVLCLQFTARTIGAAALYAAARHCDVGIEDDDAGRPWWEQIDVDLSMMRRACTRMVEFYENNAIQRHSQYYPTTPISPDEGPEKTRIQRAGVSVESKVELEATKGTETTDISHAGDNEKATRKRSREPDANDAHGNGGLESHKKPRIPHAAIFAQSTRADANSRLRPSSPTGSAHGPDFDERKRSREPHEEEIRNRRETNEDRSPKRPRMTGSTTADSNEIKSSEPPSQSFTSRSSSHAQGVVTPKEASSRRSLSRDRSRDRNHMNGHVTHDNQLHTPPLPRPPSSGCRPSYPRQPYYPHRNSDDFHWDKDMKRDRDRERDNKPGGGDPVQQRIDEIVQKSLPPPQTHHSSSSYSHHPQHDHWPENRSSGRHWGRDRDRNRDRSYDRGRDRGRDWDRERDRDRDRDNRYHYHRHHHHSRSRERSRDWGTSLLPPPPLPHHFRHERERGRSATSVSSERGSDSRRDWSSNYDHDNDYERGCDRDRNYHKHQHQHNHHKEYPNQDRINKELPAVEFGGEERRLSQGSEEGEVA